MGHFGHTENLWAVLVRVVLVHGPFWHTPKEYTGLSVSACQFASLYHSLCRLKLIYDSLL